MAAFAAQLVFFQPIADMLSYFSIAIIIFTCILSLFLVTMGATLLATAGRRQEAPHPWLLRATLLAGIPGGVFVANAAYSIMIYVLRNGG